MERTSKGVEKALEAWRTGKDVRIKMEAQTDSTSFLFQTPGIGRIKTDAQVAYEVGLGALDMDGKIISRRFQWIWLQAQIHPESTGIVCGSWRPESVPVLRHCFWADGPCIVLEPNRSASRGSCAT